MKYAITLLFAMLALAAATPAYAVSGTVSGRWRFFQNQGNYCDPAVRNCTGAQYLSSEYHTYQPIANSTVYIKDPDGNTIGTGVTSDTGNFTITWSRATTPSFIQAFWHFEHRDGRFRVRSATGGRYSIWSGQLTPVVNGTLNAGDLNVGTSSSPSGLANIYDGASRMWYNALNFSSRMRANFTDLEIRAYPTECETACARGASNQILMPAGSEFSPQGRILHEMGHIASYKSKTRSLTHGSYCYPLQEVTNADQCSDGSSNGWSINSSEWRGVALEEGRATFFGDVSIYWNTSPDPRTCLSSSTCGSNGGLESSPTCSGSIGRQALQADRYMWDIYDSVNDGTDTLHADYFSFFDTLAALPTGREWGESESFRASSGSSVDCWDCFHAWEWHNAMLNHYGGAIETQNQYFQNCMGFF